MVDLALDVDWLLICIRFRLVNIGKDLLNFNKI